MPAEARLLKTGQLLPGPSDSAPPGGSKGLLLGHEPPQAEARPGQGTESSSLRPAPTCCQERRTLNTDPPALACGMSSSHGLYAGWEGWCSPDWMGNLVVPSGCTVAD